jgi:hypothetical protein
MLGRAVDPKHGLLDYIVGSRQQRPVTPDCHDELRSRRVELGVRPAEEHGTCAKLVEAIENAR